MVPASEKGKKRREKTVRKTFVVTSLKGNRGKT
jgi:hypothetical protein